MTTCMCTRLCVFRRQRRWWHHCRTLLWRRSVSPRLCSSSRRAGIQQPLCRCHMRQPWSGSTRTHRERSRVHLYTHNASIAYWFINIAIFWTNLISLYPTHHQVRSPQWRCASGSRLATSPWPCWWSGAATRASNPWGMSSRCGAACPSPRGPPRRPCWWDSHHQRSARSPPGGPPGLWVRAQPT